MLNERHNAKVVIDLDEVLIIDQPGEEWLQQLYRTGIMLQGRGMHSKYLLERIQQRVAS